MQNTDKAVRFTMAIIQNGIKVEGFEPPFTNDSFEPPFNIEGFETPLNLN